MDTNISQDTVKSRRRCTSEEMKTHRDARVRSGLSIAEYCRRENILAQDFYRWENRHKKRTSSRSSSKESTLQQLPLSPSAPREHQSLEVKLLNGFQCRFPQIINLNQICEIIRSLSRVSSD